MFRSAGKTRIPSIMMRWDVSQKNSLQFLDIYSGVWYNAIINVLVVFRCDLSSVVSADYNSSANQTNIIADKNRDESIVLIGFSDEK